MKSPGTNIHQIIFKKDTKQSETRFLLSPLSKYFRNLKEKTQNRINNINLFKNKSSGLIPSNTLKNAAVRGLE